MKSDIFFFITTVVVIVLGILFLWLMIYLITIFKTIREITTRAKTLFNATSDDIDQMRTNIKEKGFSWTNLASMFIGKKKATKKKTDK
jgi:hypothetical protein